MFFHLVFRSIIRTLATPKVLTLDNKNEKSYSFTLYCPRLIVPLPQKIEKGHLCALTSSRFFLN